MAGVLPLSNAKKAEHIERIRINADITEADRYDSDDGRPEYYGNFD
ncbi:MAG: hypothetical protein ABSG22_09535 [Sedimentisphaerales bacterium]|jgi:hypothetical protein